MGGSKKYMFFDTETTGFPSADVSKCTANIIEIGWLITDCYGTELEMFSTLIKPCGWNTQKNWHSFKNHKIKQIDAIRFGKSITEVLQMFRDKLKEVDIIVGHNIQFDLRMIKNEAIKNKMEFAITNETQCTYKMSRKKLSVLYYDLFKKVLHAHRVANDILATKKCFFYLQRLV